MDNEATDVQARIRFMKGLEQKAVEDMLLTALRHGFQLSELTALAGEYETSAAVLEYYNDECTVYYATADGYATRKFGANVQEASDFVEQFDVWWYQ